MAGMAGKKSELGPVGNIAADNVKRIRERQRLTFAELSRMLEEIGRSIPPLGLRRIESGERRIDADDLVALAVVLNVSPLALLLPTEASQLTSQGQEYEPRVIWEWAQGHTPLDRTRDPAEQLAFVRESNPVMYEQVRAEQEAGKVNANPVAVGRVIAKRQRQEVRDRLTDGDSQ